MTLIIDGYNLLHAVGWATPQLGPGELSQARRRLLDWLAKVVSARDSQTEVWVVFDAQKGRSSSTLQTVHGIHVEFAYRQTADDVIEDRLARTSTPHTTCVVSNDSRLHESAKRVGAQGWSSQRFLDWLLEPSQPPITRAMSLQLEKPDGPQSTDEIDEWLRVFGTPKPAPRRRK